MRSRSEAPLPTEEMTGLSFVPGTLVWVHTDGWSGRMRHPGVLVKVNAKLSRVNYEMKSGMWRERLVPNRAITKRHADEQ